LNEMAASHFHDLPPATYVRLAVTDTGHGIEPDFLDRVFDPYFTTKSVGEGAGLGLAVAHGIVRRHGGRISVTSSPGCGATFHVLLPVIGKTSPAQIERFSGIPRGTERILFVDDEKAMVDAVKTMLQGLGYRVAARMNSIEALEIFNANPQGFDLIITDQTMPNLTGAELSRRFMEIRHDIPVILCTGFCEFMDKAKAKQMGIRAFLMKPIVMREMASTIRRVLDEQKEGLN